MEGLKVLIRNLTLILLLAAILEMLLPNKNMRGFVQMVMGLFVIVAVVSPLANFLKVDLANEVPAWAPDLSADMPTIAAGGDELEASAGSAVREQYKKILINQVRSLVLAIDGVKQAEVNVSLEEGGGHMDYPAILQVSVVFSLQSKNLQAGEPAPDSAKTEEIAEQISTFLQIPKEIITVSEKS